MCLLISVAKLGKCLQKKEKKEKKTQNRMREHEVEET